MRGHTSSFAGALTLLLLGPASDAGAGGAAVEAKDVVGPQECAKCHEEEYREWQETAHAAIFDSPEPLHQRPQAQEIARRLGTVLIKHDSLCLSCHYTPQVKLGRTTAVAGVSCESCHGAARGWLNLHNTFEGRQANRLGESPAQRARREAANAAAGMFAPARSYALVSRCYDCHMVPEERLVEVGGHPGGGGFDLLERFDRIRHGFVSSGRRGNAPLSPEQKRKLFLAAKVLELEHALRNLARATPGGAWASTQAERARRARKALERLDRRVALPLVRTALEATEGLPGSSPRSLALEAAAETLAGAGEAFFATAHPSQLEPLDALLGGSVGTGAEEDAGDAGKGEDEVPTAGGILGEGAQIAPASGEAGAPAPAAGASRTLQQAEGERKKVLRRPVSSTAVVDPSTCTGCHQHAEAARKLRNHPHNTSSDRFFGGGRAAQIAFFYFGKRADGFVAWGSSVCMGCHATVVRGEEGEEVSWG
ncbi:MAG: cytochrome c family protein, partial [Acidobacteria bacterium]|nr:cytochrome c family protein [Acidobacteriota bacterium]